jgi:hypothetical protein
MSHRFFEVNPQDTKSSLGFDGTSPNNKIEKLPASLGSMSHLQKLMLAGNRLQSLPEEMASCLNLELIRLSANQLTWLPPWLFNLPRLSWLAYAGNPLCSVPATDKPVLPDIDWAELTLGEILGQGASGVIYKGLWTTELAQKEVAIKIFKGEVTSDGLPTDEMAASLAAGCHDNLVNVLGKLSNGPEEKQGLVFSFIPPDYKNLGSRQTLTPAQEIPTVQTPCSLCLSFYA